MRCGIYVRISKDYAGEGLGVARQEQDCRTLATQLGWDVEHVYIDNDTSATTGAPRPAYTRMLDDMKTQTIGAVIAWHPDRLYRRVIDLGDLVDACKTGNTQIATVNAGHIDLTTPTGRLVAGLLAQVAMYEVEHKSDRWSRAWRQGREMGEWPRTGTRLYGYTRDGQVIEEEAAHVRSWTDAILKGVSLSALSREIDAAGIRASRGKQWRNATIRLYLMNPMIAGYSTLKGEIVADGTWTPLITREQYADLRALLSARARPYVGRKHLLNGLAFCTLCGTRLISGSQGRGQAAYTCSSRVGINGCGKVSIKLQPVDAFVEAYTQMQLQDPAVLAALDAITSDPTPQQRELVDLSLRVTELEAQLDRPGTSVTLLLRAIDRAKTRIGELETTLSRTVRRDTIPGASDAWPDDLHRRRALIDIVVERVEIVPRTPGRGSRAPFDTSRVKITPRL